jgi:hypothetical protein
MRDVVRRADGSFVAVCACDPWNGDGFAIKAADLFLLELNWSGLGRALCRALECDVRYTDLGVPGVRQVGAFSPAAVPVVLSIQDDRDDFRLALAGVAARLGKPFILLAPTSRFVDAVGLEILRGARAEFFDLETHVLLLPGGAVEAKKNPMELFAAFLPEEEEPVPQDVARQAFRLIEQLDSDQVVKPPSVLTVFRLYCVKEMTAEQVRLKCRCSKGTVINRLQLIREKTKMEPDELRRFSSQFDKIEDDIRESNAAYIHRKRMIDDGPSGEEGE